MTGLGTGDGVSTVSLHPTVSANTIARTHNLHADAHKNCTLHPLHSGDASIPIADFRPLDPGGPAEIHSRVPVATYRVARLELAVSTKE
jgi:hypothetical protein